MVGADDAVVRVVVGKIGRAHGLRGDVGIEVRTDSPELRFAPGSQVIAGDPAGRRLVVESTRWHSGHLLVRFVGIEGRTAAESIRGSLLEADVNASEVPSDPAEYYDRQLVGLTVVSTEGADLGRIAAIVHLTGHDLLAVALASGAEVLVPFVDSIVPVVDLAGGRVVVDPPNGLFNDEPEGSEGDDQT